MNVFEIIVYKGGPAGSLTEFVARRELVSSRRKAHKRIRECAQRRFGCSMGDVATAAPWRLTQESALASYGIVEIEADDARIVIQERRVY